MLILKNFIKEEASIAYFTNYYLHYYIIGIELTAVQSGDIHIKNELMKVSINPCLWVLRQCKIIILKILPARLKKLLYLLTVL